jgi:hypothetical protein
LRANSKARSTSSGVAQAVVTPLPWLASSGLTVTTPSLRAMRWAAASVVTVSPAGTGQPAWSSRVLVSCLSLAMPTAMLLVAPVMVACRRFCLLPQPSWNRLASSVRRRLGMPRLWAASMTAPVEVPIA